MKNEKGQILVTCQPGEADLLAVNSADGEAVNFAEGRMSPCLLLLRTKANRSPQTFGTRFAQHYREHISGHKARFSYQEGE